MRIGTYIEKIGAFSGKRIYKSFLRKWIERKIATFDIQIFGAENIDGLKRDSFILAANHLRPSDGGLFKTGVSPDSFIINQIIFDQTGKDVSLAVNYLLEAPFFKKILEEFTKGFINGLGSIPVGKGKDDFHHIFLKSVERSISENKPILIYPVGAQYEDFEKEHEIKAGASYIALKHNLPIVPVYIKGAYEWDKQGQKVYLSFGLPVITSGLTIDQISEKIKEGILKLKSGVNFSKFN